MKEAQAKTIYLDDYKPTPWQVKTIHLTFELDEEFTVVTSRIHFQRDATDDNEPLVLHGEELTLISVAVDDQLLAADDYEQTDTNLCLTNLPVDFELKTVVHIEPQNNTSLDGLYKSSGNFCSQCEAQGFRKITYYLDRPDVMSIYTTHIIANKQKYPVLLSNGNLIEQGDLDKGKHYAIWNDPHKKPSYLFALVAGTLEYVEDHYCTLSGRDVTLRIYTEAHNIDYCDHAMTSLKRAMAWDEKNFGLEYDLDIFMIVAVDDFNMGAMENKGLNIFNSRLVFASPETATDQQFISIEAVIGHEYFHNWTGNRVTCRDWFQLSLKEGLTVYRDSEFTADLHSRTVKRIEDARMLRNYQFAEDASPMAHPIRPASYMEINNFYTVTIYEKGAEVVRLYRTLLGVDGFRKGMDLYFERHDGQAVTTEDFLASMSDANNVDLSQMQRWYDQAGTPVVKVTMAFNAEQQQCTLHFEQSVPEIAGHAKSKPFLIPIKMGLLKKDGTAITLQRENEQQMEGDNYTFQLTEKKQSITFVNIDEIDRPIPSLLRDFSAPVKLDYDYSEDDYSFLMSHDSDAFNRWQAGQALAIDTLLSLITAQEKLEPMALTHGFIQAFQNILNDTELDHALISEALSLPSCSNVVDQLGKNADPDAIYNAVTFMHTT
ncbi:MAG TPA: aminopeptidase N, partial [Thiothrix sp.]|nr:aminopeptidase N [Thiothrix sp.]